MIYLGQEDPLEKEMAAHSSILAWKIPGTEEPGGLQTIGVTIMLAHNLVTEQMAYLKYCVILPPLKM